MPHKSFLLLVVLEHPADKSTLRDSKLRNLVKHNILLSYAGWREINERQAGRENWPLTASLNHKILHAGYIIASLCHVSWAVFISAPAVHGEHREDKSQDFQCALGKSV